MNRQIAAVELNIVEEAEKQGLLGAGNASAEDGGFGTWLSNILSVAMLIGAVACFGLIVWGAISWITAGGDKSKVEMARDRITTAVVGLIILAATVALFNLVANFLGITVIKFN